MPKYKIVKESKALPEPWAVGRVLETEVHSNLCWYERPNLAITQEHVNALLELGVVEEVREWDPRELKHGDKYWAVICAPDCFKVIAERFTYYSTDEIDKLNIATGNCHPTKEAAERWRDELIKKYENN